MIIGIDGSRAFLKQRTGIEEYSYQVIKHLVKELPTGASVRLYVQKKEPPIFIDFNLPKNWEVRYLWAPRFWTKIRLSLELLLHPVDALFVPAHTLPLIGGKKNVVVIHGLEYETCKEGYGLWERWYMRLSIWHSCKKTDTLIAVSENTKKDLETIYKISEAKIKVVHEGYAQISKSLVAEDTQNPFLLFIGRLEARKNVQRIIEAFELVKKEYDLPHKLVLVGRPGYGYDSVEKSIQNSPQRENIVQKGFVTEEEKQSLLSGSSAFVFPSLYEGFGLPILEAQASGVPVITSNISSLPEVGGDGALYVDPYSVRDIAQKIHRVLFLSEEERNDLIQRGYQNKDRFSWQKCAEEIVNILMN